MAVSPTPPPITPLPAPALPTDPEAVFDTKAGVSLTAQVAMVPEINAALAWVAGALVDTNGYKDAAATSAGNAADSASSASTVGGQAVTAAQAARDAAAASAASAQTSAAAAGAAAGQPSLVGNGGKALCAKLDETGVEFKSVGQQVGDILVTARIPDASYLPANKIYLQSAYPELFAKLGAQPNFSATNSASGTLPVACWGVAGSSTTFVTFGVTPGTKTDTAYRSSDGITWVPGTMPVSAYWVAATYGGGLFVAVGQSGPAGAAIATSPDGITWTPRTVPSGAISLDHLSVGYGNGRFVITPKNGVTGITSTDGITWTAITLPHSGSWEGVSYGNGIFVACESSAGGVATSVDGITWTDRAMPLPGKAQSIAFGNGKFVAISLGDGLVYSSVDGISWGCKPVGNGSAPTMGKVTFGAGIFVVVSASSASRFCWFSLDGINWTTKALPSSVIWFGVAYSKDKFVAVGTGFSASLPLFSYDKATQFTTPEVMPVLGVTAYIKAKVA